jgi:cytochrome oxidase Cu insertion factor (SCO1/SenC/PrrC family)
MRSGYIPVVVVGLLAGAAAALAVLPNVRATLGLAPPSTSTTGRALIGGPFTLTDHTGRRVSQKDFAGRPMVVFFGFTNCPDVCPSGLQVLSAALDKLGPKGDQVAPLFISVDPERDTPEQLARYVQSFHPRIVGLTGTPAEVEKAARAYRVYFKKVKTEGSAEAYTIDHSSIFYIMDAAGEYSSHATHATSPDRLAELIARVL